MMSTVECFEECHGSSLFVRFHVDTRWWMDMYAYSMRRGQTPLHLDVSVTPHRSLLVMISSENN